jgi:mobilome CxxCx(11)CxxC protein
MNVENENNDYDNLRQDCWNDALHSFGTAYIYSKRSKKIGNLLKANNFLGIIVPVVIGGIVTSYNVSTDALGVILIIAAPISVLQLILSLLSLTNKWDDSYSYYLESTNDNGQLSNDYNNLGKYPPDNKNDLKFKKDSINVKYQIRNTSDTKYPLSDKERREGMRYSLRNFQRTCAGCNIMPIDMESTNCGVCGNF